MEEKVNNINMVEKVKVQAICMIHKAITPSVICLISKNVIVTIVFVRVITALIPSSLLNIKQIQIAILLSTKQ